MADVKERVIKVVAERLSVPAAEISEAKDIQSDLGADSLSVVDLIGGLEDEFEIPISDDDANNIKTVGDAVKYIEGRIA